MPAFKPDKPKTADRGKSAEKAVQDYLTSLSDADAHFDFLRLPDARSAMGRMKSMPADFEFFAPGVHGLIEVKETAHDYRLSSSKVTQLPMIRRRMLAGGRGIVLVHHSTTKLWRRVPAAMLDPTASSWDLTEYDLHMTVESALEGFADVYG